MNLSATFLIAAALVATTAASNPPASDLTGLVTFNGIAVPGATVTATKGDRAAATRSDEDGTFRLASLEDGIWAVRVQMRGFVPLSRDVTVPTIEPPPAWILTMQPYEEIVRALEHVVPSSTLVPAPAGAATTVPAADDPAIINGSLINGAATPFAQPRAFGNNRPQPRTLYRGALSGQFGNSAWNARPYAFGGSSQPVPAYSDANLEFLLSGPLKIPWLIASGPQMTVGYTRGVHHNAVTQSSLMPTEAERGGDFSRTPFALRDPATGLSFPGNAIPRDRISPPAAALLAYYPLPNGETAGANFQTPVVSTTTEDRAQISMQKPLGRRDTLVGTLSLQRTIGLSSSVFDFEDRTRRTALDAAVSFSRRVTTRSMVRVRYQFTRSATTVTPFFAHRTNVSAAAGINGNDQSPENWGPPSLSFPDIADLRDATFQRSVTSAHATGIEASLNRGRHNITVGGDARWTNTGVLAQQDPRGGFGFTGAYTGSALADFLLGLPETASMASGNADKRLRGLSYDAYVNDDWRVNAGLTLNVGLRWEYESPFSEALGRLVNLDLTPDLSRASPVLASDPIGPLTGAEYQASLLRPYRAGLQPRLAVSWRPTPGSSLVIRGGYSLSRNTSVYQPLALLLAQQPPLSRTFSVQSTPLAPLTLANGLLQEPLTIGNTLAIDPDVRPGVAHNWQASLQRELPGNLTVLVQYLGTRGRHLMQASLPNTNPSGAVPSCSACPSGFVYLSSNGRSLRHAMQVLLRRRLRNGLTASVEYTRSRATDDAATFNSGAVSASSLAIAQNWRDLRAEHGPSSFDQPHLVAAEVQYTTGVGVTGGTLATGFWGSVYKDWTITSRLRSGSGLPATPVYFVPVAGSGVVGVRPRLTGIPATPVSPGAYANAAAYAAPDSGTWGDAGRNSIRGPRQFSLDASVARVFRLGGRVNLEWRVDATNVLNRVTFGAINAVISSPQFGLPTVANAMRRVQTSIRLRF